MVTFRRALQDLYEYVPGRPGDVATAEGTALLASNEVPLGPLPSVREAIAASARDANRYPDMEATALRSVVAQRHGVDPAQIVTGCGSVEVCRQAVMATVDPGDEVVFGWPSFAEYDILTSIAGGVARKVPLRDATYDLDAMAAVVGPRTRMVFVCNPNNPTSTAVPGEDVERFVAAVPQDCLVAFDEAYWEFIDDPRVISGFSLLERHPNVLVLRTFSKAHGLAGLRIGYGVGSLEVAAALRKVRIPFGASALAQAAAIASVGAEGEMAGRVREVVAERARVTKALEALGAAVPTSQANFLWVTAPGRAAAMGRALAAEGVLVRPVGADALRVTLGTAAENDRFLAAYERVSP